MFARPSTRFFSTITKKATSTATSRLTLYGAIGAAFVGGLAYKNSMETEAKRHALNKDQWIPFTLKEVEHINHNSAIFRFELPAGQDLGMPITSCVMTRFPDGTKDEKGNDKFVMRPYTPLAEGHGHWDLLVKKYENGAMSSHIHSLKPGDKLDVKGPFAKLPYEPNKYSHMGLIAGGSGITPMIQLARHVLENPQDDTKITLVFANQEERDILLRNLLDLWQMEHPTRFRVHYALDKPPSGWSGQTGYVNGDMMTKLHFPKPSDGNVLIGVCGPDPMLASIAGPKAKDKSQGELGGILKSMGYTPEQVYKF